MNAVSPEVLHGLLKFGLITPEQAEVEQAKYEVEWHEYFETRRWWDELADIAWENETSLLARILNFGLSPALWKMRWIAEKQGEI